MRQFLTPDDLKKGDLVNPGWYPSEIVDYTEEPAKTDGSTNCYFYFKVLDGPFKGVTIRKLFNEKALGFGKALWATLKFPFDPATGYELTTELFKQTIGQKLMIYVQRGKSDKGNEFNDVKDFKPLVPTA
jgi:hypothetical protein